jgi:hypothetical protein
MMYGKQLMDAFDAERRDFLRRDEFAAAEVMSNMESAVNNVMHGRPAQEIHDYAVDHIGRVLGDGRIALYRAERDAYKYALDVIDSVPVP